MNTPPVYCISGLGLNEKLFIKLRLDQPFKHIKWIDPLPKEQLSDYCLRLTEQISDDEPPIIIGVSFGGIAAIEISKLIPTAQIIIVSSIKTYKERPWLFDFIRAIPVYRWGKQRQFRFRSIRLWGWMFGLRNPSAREYFVSMLSETSEKYISWAISQIAHWKNEDYPETIMHIHGNKDRIFPWRLIKNATMIPQADHGMIVVKASEISNIIREKISQIKEGRRRESTH